MAKAGREAVHEIYEEIVSIEDKMTEIQGLLAEKKRVVFAELFGSSRSRNLLIVTFLAILEIVRSRIARVLQEEQFGEIVIEKVAS